MKARILWLAMACLCTSPMHAQSKRELRKQQAAQEFLATESLVESGSFRFEAKRAHPTGMRSIDLTGNVGFAEISDGSAIGDLPFFGRAGSVGYSPEAGGIKFEGEMEGVTLSVNEKKQNISLTFSVKSGRDQYKCIFTIAGRNSVSLGISSNFRNQISYDGLISALEKEQ
jgi:hypothetical protein